MDNQPQSTISSTTMMTALAGILFFGPFIKSEDAFVQWYCKVWKLNLILLAITSVAFLLNYHFTSAILDRIILLTTGAICALSLCSIFTCLHEVVLFEANTPTTPNGEPTPKPINIPHKEMILKSFIPIYNIKLRYQTPNFQTPYRRAKESILLRTICCFLTLLLGIKIWIFIISCILIRLFLLLVNIDLIPNNVKKFLNHEFLIYPGENKEEKETNKRNIILQYTTFTILLALIRKNATLNYNLIIPLFALLYLISFISLTYKKFQKIPNIPLLSYLYSLIIK